MSACLLLRGMKTLALRIERQNQNALKITKYLQRHPGKPDPLFNRYRGCRRSQRRSGKSLATSWMIFCYLYKKAMKEFSHCFLLHCPAQSSGMTALWTYCFIQFLQCLLGCDSDRLALGSEEISGLQAEVKVVSCEIVLPPRIKAETASISRAGAIA